MSNILKLTIKTLGLRTINVEMDERKRVEDLKSLLFEEQHITIMPDKQQLIYAGRTLENEDLLVDYDIDERKFLVVMSKPRNIKCTEESKKEKQGKATEGNKNNKTNVGDDDKQKKQKKSKKDRASRIFEHIRNHPMFQQALRDARYKPEQIGGILGRLDRQNQKLTGFMENNLDEFFELVGVDKHEIEANVVKDILEPEERVAVDRLVAMGFNRASVLDAYFTCDKNEEKAVALLSQQSKQRK